MVKEKINYLKAAFHTSINYAFLVVMIGLGLPLRFRWPFLVLVGAIEMGLLLFISQNKRFRRHIKSKIERQKRAPKKLNPDKIKVLLEEESSAKFEKFDEIYFQIKNSTGLSDSIKTELFRITLTKLDQLRETYAHMILVYQNYKQYLHRVNRDEIERRIESLGREVSTRKGKVAVLMEQNIQILHERLKRIKRAWDNLEVLEAEMEILLSAMSLIQDQTIAINDPEGITQQIDSVLENMRDTESVIEEMDMFFRDEEKTDISENEFDIDEYPSKKLNQME